MKKQLNGLIFGAVMLAGSVQAAPILLSPEWAAEACQGWNNNEVLTKRLVVTEWVNNHKGRGFKVMQIYRSDCPASPRVEMRVSLVDGKAKCVYGGLVQTAKLETDADYVMWAETTRWKEMGAGEYGPMRAMMFGRLNFQGPKGEAMSNMGPFEQFLLLAGKGDAAQCPAAAPAAPAK